LAYRLDQRLGLRRSPARSIVRLSKPKALLVAECFYLRQELVVLQRTEPSHNWAPPMSTIGTKRTFAYPPRTRRVPARESTGYEWIADLRLYIRPKGTPHSLDKFDPAVSIALDGTGMPPAGRGSHPPTPTGSRGRPPPSPGEVESHWPHTGFLPTEQDARRRPRRCSEPRCR
jgi:hypothetical protein